MKNFHLLITAGPTQEPIDPVRFISNRSTGFLGYTLAKEAKKRGFSVTLISGPTNLKVPQGVRFMRVNTAQEMYKEVKKNFPFCDCLLMTAGVCDFCVDKPKNEKIKKEGKDVLVLRLRKNPDILYEMGKRKGKKILIGFSLESKDLYKNSLRKLKEKNLDLLIAQRIDKNPFGKRKVSPLFIYRDGSVKKIPFCSKEKLSSLILKEINALTFKKLNDRLSEK